MDGGIYTSGLAPSEEMDEGMSVEAANSDNDDNGTITIVGFAAGDETSLLIKGVRLDVSDASGPVTVTMEVETGTSTLVT